MLQSGLDVRMDFLYLVWYDAFGLVWLNTYLLKPLFRERNAGREGSDGWLA
jgi:hypothetical protein